MCYYYYYYYYYYYCIIVVVVVIVVVVTIDAVLFVVAVALAFLAPVPAKTATPSIVPLHIPHSSCYY